MKRTLLILLVLCGLFVTGGSLVGGYLLGTVWRGPYFLVHQKVDDNPVTSQSREKPYQGVVAIYAQNCSGCHGVDGGGTPFAPSLNSLELRSCLDGEGLYETILNGRSGTAMPSWEGRLTADQIISLVALIRNWDSLDEEDLAELDLRGPEWGGIGHMRSMDRIGCRIP